MKQIIDEFMHAWNENPKPFIWTASVGQIIEKIAERGRKLSRSSPDPRFRADEESKMICNAIYEILH